MSKLIDLTGRVFTHLTVLHKTAAPRGRAEAAWLCQCACGNTCIVLGSNLRTGNSKSCGCRGGAPGHKRTHGMSRNRMYVIWTNMWQRCTNPRRMDYPRYGGAGVSVCARWSSYENFYTDMRDGYQPGLTIDRIDPCKGYAPENCRWANYLVQNRNRRVTLLVATPVGKLTPEEFSFAYGPSPKTVRRWHKAGVVSQKMGWLGL